MRVSSKPAVGGSMFAVRTICVSPRVAMKLPSIRSPTHTVVAGLLAPPKASRVDAAAAPARPRASAP
ncbi:hypothetical protein D3C71_1624850 [compost metagenome]